MAGKEYVLPETSGYRVIRRLGSGGEGTVYLVCHINTEQLRAAKVLTHIRENCRHELDMMKNLNHPSLPKVIDILEEGENTWLIMEYIQGHRLDQVIAQGLDKKQLWSIANQLALVLVYLHSRKKPVLHLDIKPSNILLRPDKKLVLIDFGASIRGHPDGCVNSGYGTPGFAAPEQQTEGGSVDARTDLFGAGAVLYYCRYGKTPNPDKKWQRRNRLDHVMAKCLEKEPDRRYADSLEFYRAVCRAERAEKRNRIFFETLGAGAMLALSGVLLFSNLQAGEMTSLSIPLSSSTDQEKSYGSMQENGIFADVESEAEDREAESTEENVSDMNRQEYSRLLNMAGGLGFSQAMECYRSASALFPGDGEWYLRLLEYVTSDGLFEESEEEFVKELIYTLRSDGSTTAMELLETDAESYGIVAYRLGLAYWYFYEGSGGKSAAAWWFQKALSSQPEDKAADWIAAAEILSQIGSYYGMLGSTGTDEERLGKEWNYWKDLQELWNMYRLQQEDVQICSESAEELLSLLTLHAYDLRQNGEAEEAMLVLISDIEGYLSENLSEMDAGEQEKRMEMVQNAKNAVERAFQS